MAEQAQRITTTQEAGNEERPISRKVMLGHACNELVFGLVGHAGSGNSVIGDTLNNLLRGAALAGGPYEVIIIKARDVILEWAKSEGNEIPFDKDDDLHYVEKLQDWGDEIRRQYGDHAAVAKKLIQKIRMSRAERTGVTASDSQPVQPDGKRRAYILDSVRHPAEVSLLRHVYQEAFILIGSVCEEEKREQRIQAKYKNAGKVAAQDFMKRDAKASEKYGQRVADTFHLSDFFVDNTEERLNPDGTSNVHWDINEKLSRLIKIITHAEIIRPTSAESAMYYAYGATMRSACLSRQVGSSLIDGEGNVLAVGTNEVPKAGGGVYGESFDTAGHSARDERCAYRQIGDRSPFCSNVREQNEIIGELIHTIPELKAATSERKMALEKELRNSRIGSLIEFSRAVHAEMDALLSAARKGISTVGTRLFVTTFPCHYCARHIVSAGIDEVQFIEPYLKSRALKLHNDSIQINGVDWDPPSKGGSRVLFRPFTGVAPKLYRRAFLKDRDLKNDEDGIFNPKEPEWGTPWQLSRASYVQLEAELAEL